MKKALVISTYFEHESGGRPFLVYKYLQNRYDVKLLVSNYSHSRKRYFKQDDFKNDIVLIEVPDYKKNISLSRIWSHYKFARNVEKFIKKEKVDLVYVCVPPNLVGYISTLTAKKAKSRVILDVIDVWPETFPIKNKFFKKIFLLTIGVIWKEIRNKAIAKADFIITESYLFKHILRINKPESSVIWLSSASNTDINPSRRNNNDALIIGYIGNINKIVNFDSLLKILVAVGKQRKIRIEIIGDGELREELILQIRKWNIEYKFWGIVYEQEKKKRIMQQWDFGYNGQSDSVVTALSYKSIDYFSCGIPLLNSVKADTWDLIDKEKCGYNFKHDQLDGIIEILKKTSDKELKIMKQRTWEVYYEYFTYDKFVRNMDALPIWE